MIEFNGFASNGENPVANLDVRTEPIKAHLRKLFGKVCCAEDDAVLLRRTDAEDASLVDKRRIILSLCTGPKNNPARITHNFKSKSTSFS